MRATSTGYKHADRRKMNTDLDFHVCSDAGKDALSHSSDDASRIPDAFIATNLDVVLAEENSLPS